MTTFDNYKDAQQHQLDEWVAGRPWHNPFDPFGSIERGGECCPDFSCCQPQLLAPERTRKAFANATDAERHEMLMGFLGGCVAAATDKKVHIAGDSDDGTRQ